MSFFTASTLERKIEEKNKFFLKQTARESPGDFSSELRKKKRMSLRDRKRWSNCEDSDIELEVYLRKEKSLKARISISRIETLILSIFHELSRFEEDVKNNSIAMHRERFKDFLFICEDFYDVFNLLDELEKENFLSKLESFILKNSKFCLVLRVSSVHDLLKTLINEANLDSSKYKIFLHLLSSVISKNDLTQEGQVNVIKIINELLKKSVSVPNEQIMFMALILENNPKLILDYFYFNYICANLDQFRNSKKLSAEQLSIILSGIVSVDIKEIRLGIGMTLIEIFQEIMNHCSQLANLNVLICIQRFVSANKTNGFFIIVSHIFSLILMRLLHFPQEISEEASAVILVLAENNHQNSNAYMIKYNLVETIVQKLSDISINFKIYKNLVWTIEILADYIVAGADYSIRNELASVIGDVAESFSDKEKGGINEIQKKLVGLII